MGGLFRSEEKAPADSKRRKRRPEEFSITCDVYEVNIRAPRGGMRRNFFNSGRGWDEVCGILSDKLSDNIR